MSVSFQSTSVSNWLLHAIIPGTKGVTVSHKIFAGVNFADSQFFVFRGNKFARIWSLRINHWEQIFANIGHFSHRYLTYETCIQQRWL